MPAVLTNDVIVNRFFRPGKPTGTQNESVGYAEYRHPQSQHVEVRIEDPVVEVLANHSPFGDAARC